MKIRLKSMLALLLICSIVSIPLFRVTSVSAESSDTVAGQSERTSAPATEVLGSLTNNSKRLVDLTAKSSVTKITDPKLNKNTTSNYSYSTEKSQMEPTLQVKQEVVEKRTRVSRTFINTNGNEIVESTPYSMNYQDGNTWKKIDTTLRSDRSNRNYTHSMLENNYNVHLNNQSGNSVISFAVDSHSVTYKPVGMNGVTGSITGDTIRYPLAWTSTDLIYQIQPDEMKMEIHLLDKAAPKTFSFEMQTQGVSYRQNSDNSIDFLNASGTPLFKIPSFWIQDASSSDRQYDRLKVSVSSKGSKTFINLSLNDEGLQYPIVIDPSTALIFSTLQGGGNYYLYDLGGKLSQIASNLGTVDYQYDMNGNLLRRSKSNNLLVNGSFELNTATTGLADGWNKFIGGSGPEFATSSSPVSAGLKAQKIADYGLPSGNFTGMYQNIRVDPNSAYILSGELNITNLTNAKVQVYVDFLNAQNQYVGNAITDITNTTNGKFMTAIVSGTTPSTATYAYVYFLLRGTAAGGSGTFYVDLTNFRYDAEPNLLSNAGFESYTGISGLADGWIRSTGGLSTDITVSTSAVNEGFRSHKISDSGIASGSYSGIQQNVKMEPNKAYTMNGIFFISALTNSKVQLYLDFYNSQHQLIGSNLSDNTLVKPNISLSISGTTPANTAYATIYILLRATGNGGSGTLYVDLVNLHYDSSPNKVANGGFESVSAQKIVADGWSGVASTLKVVTSPVYAGSRAQKMMAIGLPAGYITYLSQDLKVEPYAVYAANALINIQLLYNAKVQLYIDFLDAQDQYLSSMITEWSSMTTGYFNFYASGTTPPNSAYARVYVLIRATAANGLGTIYADSIRFS